MKRLSRTMEEWLNMVLLDRIFLVPQNSYMQTLMVVAFSSGSDRL
ncbi:hypothetical protein [Bartonella vinsonii]|nr:hypothetical protein [Bartonella vinsonii]